MDAGIEITGTGADVKRLLASEIGIPWSNSPVFERQLARVPATQGQRALARSFHRDGYLVLEDWVAPELCDRIVADSEGFYDPRAEYPDLPPQVVTLLKQGLEQAHSCRVQDAWWVSEAVKALACAPRILELLQFLYQRAPIPFQTLSFPVGSEQATHADTIHFDSIPSMFMCGVWVALQDVGPDDGPVFYHPGSHKLPVVRMEQLGRLVQRDGNGGVASGDNYDRYLEYVRLVEQSLGAPARRLEVKKGTVLIWSANLLHGGSCIDAPGNSRHSQVTHYFFEGCAYVSPILSNMEVGEYFVRPVWDILREKVHGQTIAGAAMDFDPGVGALSRFHLPGSGA